MKIRQKGQPMNKKPVVVLFLYKSQVKQSMCVTLLHFLGSELRRTQMAVPLGFQQFTEARLREAPFPRVKAGQTHDLELGWYMDEQQYFPSLPQTTKPNLEAPFSCSSQPMNIYWTPVLWYMFGGDKRGFWKRITQLTSIPSGWH